MLSVKIASSTSSFDIDLAVAFIKAMPEAVLLLSPDIRVLAANAPAMQTLPSLKVGGPLALSLRDPTVLDAVRRVEAGGPCETAVWRDRVPVERTFEVTVAPLAPHGVPQAVVLTLHDLTEAHRIERMRAEFIANASHELRTPLASLLGFVETLQGPARDDARARERFLGIMADQARRMARLVDDLLSLSRIEQKRHIRPSAPVDLSSLVGHVADTLGPIARDGGLTFHLAIEPGVIVTGDRDELVRVAENLIENAIKYGRPSGPRGDDAERCTIAINVARRGGQGTLTVRDQGDGIAREHLPRLTERFYRIDAGQSRAKGGTGLGLALVKHIVAHHRGRFSFDSILADGSVFSVAIPLFGKA
ncbi:ATP-binding protein [Lichenihabitans sp. Uapishka_5]|uniref:ATP-binding protein n=1 Tax=Lichenihabitans sp. Uapishka_5 TaxID=3037302 RepID=UPI0029E82655|nr:ATP-binding protein [Lichenihabitans sp. Uapishka_5]MDX7949710.1 ATP-binding protein [Lichenihabitans sp. Uapishka_5]